MDQNTSDIVLFFGRFHPLVLHLPIGFLVIAFVLEVCSRFERFKNCRPAVGLILKLGAASAVVAAILGYMLAQAGGYNEELLFIHQWSGIALAFAALAASLLHRLLYFNPSASLDRAYLSLMGLMMLALTIAGHFGGSLTHGSNYLTQYMPDPLRTIAGLPPKENKEIPKITDVNQALVFDHIIYPILDTRCISCHNESKSKGDLMMHTKEALLKGGENGVILVAGNVNESELIKRIHLPEMDEEHMPPEGKRQLTDEQVKLLTWWIEEGAPFDKTVAELKVDEEIQVVLSSLADPDANKSEVELLMESGVQPAETQKIKHLQNKGITVRTLSANTNWLEAEIPQDHACDSLMTDLLGIADQLVWLDMRKTEITDENIAAISQLKNLTRLHLEKTKITDQGLQHLKSLAYLEYLNLYGTRVSDEGILALAELKNLRKLYLWQTQVTEKGVKQLSEALPELEISLGFEVESEKKPVTPISDENV